MPYQNAKNKLFIENNCNTIIFTEALDANLLCFGEGTDEEICRAIVESKENVAECYDDDNEEDIPKPVGAKEALQALYTLQNYLKSEIPDHDTMTFASLESIIEHRVLGLVFFGARALRDAHMVTFFSQIS